MYHLNLLDFEIGLEVLPIIDYSGITTNSFTIIVTAITKEQAAGSTIVWLFESLKIDEQPDFSKKNLFRIIIDIIDQTKGFERDLTSDEICRVLTQYDNDEDTVASEATNSTIGRKG